MFYEFEKKEGFLLVSELEKLRQKKHRDKLVMRCNESVNKQAGIYRKMYIFDESINKVLYAAQHYYLLIRNNDVVLYLIYDECRIAYCLWASNDWRIISVEFLPPKTLRLQPRRDESVGKALSLALTTLLSFTYVFGFSRVFKSKETRNIQKIFTSIAHKEFCGNNPETDMHADLKIEELLAHNAMRREFVDQFLARCPRLF